MGDVDRLGLAAIGKGDGQVFAAWGAMPDGGIAKGVFRGFEFGLGFGVGFVDPGFVVAPAYGDVKAVGLVIEQKAQSH